MATKRSAPAKAPAAKAVTKNLSSTTAPVKPRTSARSPAKRALRSTTKIVAAARPTSVRFYLADDMRQEVGGKVTAVGLYADNVIVAEMSPNDPDPTAEQLAALGGVSILASVSMSPGEHECQFEIEPSSVVPPLALAQSDKFSTSRADETVNMIMRLAPLPFTRFGMVHLVLRVDGNPHSFSFEIRRRNKPM